MLDIKNKQNSPEILDLLFLQRILCEKIEYLTIWTYILTLMIPIIGFLTGNCYYFIIVNLSLILINNYLIINRKKTISTMVTIKEIIDRTLFGLNLSNIQLECSKETIEELLIKQKEKKYERYIKEISNSGINTYRGVKDWYFYEDISEDERKILSCQKQNVYFTEKLSKSFKTSIIFFIIIIVIAFIIIKPNITIKDIIVYYFSPFSTFITLIWNDSLNYIDFKKILIELKFKFKNLENKKYIQKKDLEEIQNLIFLYRKTEYRPPLEIFHWKFSKSLHLYWEKIVKSNKN